MEGREKVAPGRNAWWAVGAVVLAVVCCAGPTLIAGGVLAAIGGFISGGYIIGLGILLAFAGLVIAVNRRHHLSG